MNRIGHSVLWSKLHSLSCSLSLSLSHTHTHTHTRSASLLQNNLKLLSSFTFFDLFPVGSSRSGLIRVSSLRYRASLCSLSLQEIAMDKGQGQIKASKWMPRFVSRHSFAILFTTILSSMLAFNFLKKKSADKERTKGASVEVGSGLCDVFLSFRGSDTPKEFTDHLYNSLIKAGSLPISVFRDDNSIPIGEEFDSEILDAIAWSKISILVISENYVSCKWSLRKLIHIMDHKKSTSHIVLPIFYEVARSDVRYLEGNFGNAFHLSKKHFEEKDTQEVQRALNEVSYLNGWEFKEFADRHEGELIERVVETVVSKLQKDFEVDVPQLLVGLDDHMKKIMNWIDNSSINARMIGIYGMGGIGKTTLAKSIYNQLLNKFVHVSFLPNVRETTRRHGITYLQSQLMSDLLHIKSQVSRVDDGINRIESGFKQKKVLILLDDIDYKNQLDALAGQRHWFMAGSLIIVTTRYKAVLDQSEFMVDYMYELNELDKVQSLLLFNRHAFRKDHSPRDFGDISHDIISTLGGLPLALQVVGSYLYRKTNKNVWKDVLKQLKNQPHKDVQKILQISYDALEDEHKQIFLDIACFLIGQPSRFAMYMWEDSGLYPSQGIEELKLRCLIKIGDDDEFEMHDQLRDLGRSIFCRGQPLEKHRPWDNDYKGVSRVLRPIEISHWFHDLMRAASSGDSKELLSEVRWLEWSVDVSNLSLSTTNLGLLKLLVLDLSHSKMTEDWEGWNLFTGAKQLKVLNLEQCPNLRYSPHLSTFTQLKILILRDCSRLQYLHHSIGKLTSLVSLDLGDCFCLKELPEELGKLKDLEELKLDSASIIEIPTSIASLWKLKKLSAANCKSLKVIPSSIWDLQNLQHLDLSFSGIEKLPSAIGRLKDLRILSLRSCRSLKGAIPSEIGDLSLLEILDMSWAFISDLPESIQNLSSLQRLSLWGCVKLRSLPELPSGLTYLSVSCQSLRLPQLSSLIHLEELHLQAGHFVEEDIPSFPQDP